MSLSIEILDGYGGLGALPTTKPVVRRVVLKKPLPPKPAPAPAKASVPVKVVTPTYVAPPKLSIVKAPAPAPIRPPTKTATVTTTTTTTAALLAARAAAPKGTVALAPKTTTVIGGKTFTSTAPPTKVMAPYQPPKTTSLINPALVGKSAYPAPATVYPIGVKQPGTVAPTYAPPPTGNTWSGPAPVAPGTQQTPSGTRSMVYTPYGSGDSYGMTAEQAANAAADEAAASDPLVSDGGGGGGGGAAAEGEAAAEAAAAEKPGLKVQHVVGGAMVIGVLAYFLL